MPSDFDRKTYALDLLGKLLSTLPEEARIFSDNLPYSAVVGWPFVRADGSAGMQTRTWLWPGSFAIALHHETHEVIIIELTRETPSGPAVKVELPGGGIDPGNKPLLQAKLELEEETGAVATDRGEWIQIGPEKGFNPIDGLCWTEQHSFLCTSAHVVKEREVGIRKVTTYPLSRLVEMDNENAFSDPLSPYFLRRAHDWLEKNRPDLLT